MTVERRRREAGWLRGIARALGLSLSALWLFLVVAGGIASLVGGDEDFTWESVVLLAMIVAAVGGVALAWRDEWSGGWVITAAGAGLCVFALISADRNQLLAMAVAGVPFVVTGTLFLWLGGGHDRRT